jgi:protein-L-isoaspartate(D-aspartate) O-methyltransferase
MSEPADPQRLMRFVLEMRQAGVTDPRALGALERVSRADFAPPSLAGLALDDVQLPLDFGQTMTKPSVVGRVIQALDLQDGMSVLEIGVGSGFQTAAIAQLASKVIGLDRWRRLVTDARERIGRARLMHVNVHLADGRLGWAEAAPYDRIIVNAAASEPPPALLEHLSEGGALVMPIEAGGGQTLTRIGKDGARAPLFAVKFAPLESGSES